jgi:hypothetical protein
MPKLHQLFSCVVALIVLVNMPPAIYAAAEPTTRQFIQLQSKPGKQDGKNTPLQLGIKEGKQGVQLSITFSGEKITLEKGAQTIPPGGMFTVSLDGTLMVQETFSEPTLHVEKMLPMQTLANGEHVVRCELRSLGKTYQAEMPFTFDATPIVTLEKFDPKSPAPDPVTSFRFYNENQEIVGFIDVAVDERSLGVTQIATQNNGERKPLSQWLGKPIAVAELPPGQHLIKLTATGSSGAENIQFIPFRVEAVPILDVAKNKEGTMESIKATFLQASGAYSGTVDIIYRQGVILSIQSKEPTVLINKGDIVQAFAQHKLPLPSKPTHLVVGLRSANNTENWQAILFQP